MGSPNSYAVQKRPLKKQDRRVMAIKSLISQSVVRTQDELKDKLKEKGFFVTQSSLSRDIKRLGLIKQDGAYQLPHISTAGSLIPPSLGVTKAGGHLFVVQTLPAMAPTLASIIDELSHLGIAGTIAGDDTVFVAVATDGDIDQIIQHIKTITTQIHARI